MFVLPGYAESSQSSVRLYISIGFVVGSVSVVVSLMFGGRMAKKQEENKKASPFVWMQGLEDSEEPANQTGMVTLLRW